MPISIYRWLCVTLLVAISSLGQAADKLAPEVVPGAETIDAYKAKALFKRGVLFVDVRNAADWDAGRVPGALHLNLITQFTEENLSAAVGKNQQVVIYCNGPKCLRSSRATKKAVDWGFQKVYFFREGFPSWQSANLPIE